jgi:deazaflavin-dependent oxidoreductase (nitroreductase family)
MPLSTVGKPRTYRLTFMRRLVNALISALVRLGAGPNSTYLLITRGRRTGKVRTTPVTLIEADGRRWLVAPYGPVGWVHNARTNKLAMLRRGRHSETVRLEEVTDPLEAARVLKSYVTQVAVVRPFFDTPPDAPEDAFVAEVPHHPVFRVVSPTADAAVAADGRTQRAARLSS